MKSIAKLFVTVVLSMLVATVSAQVKQVFQVFDYDTKKPLAGATNTLYGQTLTTNAQGIAVVNLPADKKGAYLTYEQWQLDGYTYLGRSPESFYAYFQSKDTLKCYMVETSKYRAAVNQTFEQLFRFSYAEDVLPVSKEFEEDIQAHPENSVALASTLVDASLARGNVVRNCYDDATEINKYDLYEYTNPQFDEVKQVLQTGDVNKAVRTAKSQVNLSDNSRSNLEWIEFYRDLWHLYSSTEDEDTISKYSEILYKNHYSPTSNLVYVQDLNRNNFYDKADSVSAIEKKNNIAPRFLPAFEPYPLRYVLQDENPAKLKTAGENVLNMTKNIYQQYPHYNTLSDLAWAYKNSYLYYSVLKDSVLAVQVIDSCLYYKQKWLDVSFKDRFERNQKEIRFNQFLLDYIALYPAYLPQTVLYQLLDEIYNLSKENYLKDTANLFLKAQLAENALLWLKNAPEVEGALEKRGEVMDQLTDVNFALAKDFPELYAVQNVQVASQLVGNCLMTQCDNDRLLETFRKYERSFDVINALYPKTFVDIYLRYNRMLDGYLAANQQFVLSSELADFSNQLLNIKADNDPKQLIVKKAEYANEMAETLYQNEMYEESIAYYLQANELYQKAVSDDEQLWIPYLRNYLQMGDAHLYQNQYDRAVMTYQKILDFEPQIPASVMPQYTRMKGNVYYYIGDVYKATGETANAEKSYKNAEKFFKKAYSMGDVDAYQSMGEMYWGKAVMAAQNKDMKKCRQMVAQSVIYYEKTNMTVPLNTYLRAKSVMADFYKEEQDAVNYYRTIGDLTDYYEKFAEYDRDYAVGLIQNAETMLNSGTVSNEDALRYAHDLVNGVLYLNDYGEDVRLALLRGSFTLAKAYTANDSVQQAIDIYRDCLKMSEVLFADTAMDTHKGNMVEIYTQLVKCYEQMAEKIDTAHSELWYYRVIDTRDTLIDLMKELASDGDVNRTYRTAIQYRNNGATFYHLEMIPSAQDYFDKSNELLMMLYNSEYKDEVEGDIIQNYVLKGLVYEDADNIEKAIENLRIAVEYGERADLSEEVPPYYYVALSALAELLQKDEAANAQEIKKLKKELKEVSKKLK